MLLLDGEDSEYSAKNEEEVTRENSDNKSNDVWNDVAFAKGLFRPAKEDDRNDTNDCCINTKSKCRCTSSLIAHSGICALTLNNAKHCQDARDIRDNSTNKSDDRED